MTEEAPIDPALPIVDAHHHLWDHGGSFAPYLLPQFLAEVEASGHNIVQTVYAECGSFYRAEGPEEMRAVGETEFVVGVAAMAASGRYGPCRVAAGIVSAADMTLGDAVKPVLEAQIAAGRGRARGIRFNVWCTDAPLFGHPAQPGQRAGLMRDPVVQAGVRAVGAAGLTFEVWALHTQLADVAALADACPDTVIVLNHIGTPVFHGPGALGREETFAIWKQGMTELARRPNIILKIGGLGMDVAAAIGAEERNLGSCELAPLWESYVQTSIAVAGVNRCMFESNFPPDRNTCSYGALWNAFKRLSSGASVEEKTALFSGTARRVYSLPQI